MVNIIFSCICRYNMTAQNNLGFPKSGRYDFFIFYFGNYILIIAMNCCDAVLVCSRNTLIRFLIRYIICLIFIVVFLCFLLRLCGSCYRRNYSCLRTFHIRSFRRWLHGFFISVFWRLCSRFNVRLFYCLCSLFYHNI